MNYFSKTEKILKSCLKEKLTITTATIVGFLIAGSISYGMTVNGQDKGNNFDLTTAGQVVSKNQNEKLNIKGGEIKSDSSEGSLISIEATSANSIDTVIEKGTTLKGENITDSTLKVSGNVSLTNNGIIEKAQNGNEGLTIIATENGNINFTNNSEMANIKIDSIGQGNKISINNINGDIESIYTNYEYNTAKTISVKELSIENSSTIASTKKYLKINHAENNSGKNSAIFITGNADVNSKLNIINKETGVIGNNELSNGIYISGTKRDIYIENSGKIIGNDIALGVSGKNLNIINKSTGVIEGGHFGLSLNNYSGNNYTINNFGEIVVTGIADHGDSTGLSLMGSGVATNESTGIIDVTANTKSGATGVIVDGTYAKGEGKFINNGTIKVHRAKSAEESQADIKGIYVYKNATAINNGTLEIDSFGTNGSESIAIYNEGGTAINNGIIKISDKTLEEFEKDGRTPEDFFVGTVINKGSFVDKDGNYISTDNEVVIEEKIIDVDKINQIGNEAEKVVVKGNTTIAGGDSSVNVGALNVAGGNLAIENANNKGVNFKDTNINISKNDNQLGKITIGGENKADLTISNGSINRAGDNSEADIIFANADSTLSLIDGNANVNIGESNSNGTVNVFGTSSINGNITVKEMNIGNELQPFDTTIDKMNKLNLSETAKISGGSVNIQNNGQLVLAIDSNNENNNALKNSTGVTVTGNNNDDIALDLSNMNGEGTTISLGNGNKFTNVDVTTTTGDNGVYIVDDFNLSPDGTTESTITIKYNDNLYANNPIINNIHKQAQWVNEFISSDVAERERQLDTIYGANIYSQTVRVTYDNYKLNENTVLSLGRMANTGEWVATGSYLYTDKSFDREGTLKDYNTDVESHGLLANIEYGLNEKSSLGFVFSGTKQDVDTVGGDADGDLFYLGAYNKTTVGNKIDFTYGIGYQLGKYDANNNIGKVGTSSSYDTNTYGVFAQIKRDIDLGDNLTIAPKFKLGYTYIDQDDVKDSYLGIEDASTSTVDANLGVELSKVVPMEKGNVTFTTGVEYTKVFGDTDKEFRGSFNGKDGGRNYFDVLGAELSEDNVKLTLTGTMEQNNGVFYNLGLSYTFGEKDTEETNVQVGLGYRF